MKTMIIAFLCAVKAYSLIPLVLDTDCITQNQDATVQLTVGGKSYWFSANKFNENEYLVVTDDIFGMVAFNINRNLLEESFRDEQNRLREVVESDYCTKAEVEHQESVEVGFYIAYCMMFGMQYDDVYDDRKGEKDDYLMP